MHLLTAYDAIWYYISQQQQAAMLAGDEAVAAEALTLWEETGSGQSWVTKAPKSITSSLLFCARGEFRSAQLLTIHSVGYAHHINMYSCSYCFVAVCSH
jgi:hypothetical protein